MVKYLRFHIEGGRNKTQDVEMRQAFHVFFSELFDAGKSKDVRVTFMLHGGRKQAYEKFCYALSASPEDYHVLLVDSEDPVEREGKCWQHLKRRTDDKWVKPKGSREDQCQLMAQAVEAWLFADPDSLAAYYKQGFQPNSLPDTLNVETIPRSVHVSSLEAATRNTQKKRYHKYDHLPGILMTIDPRKVRSRAPHCERIFSTLQAKIVAGVWDD
jgi:hypothetical protein